MVYFWACEVTDTKAAVVKVPENYVLNVCNATVAGSFSKDTVVSLGLETQQMDKQNWKGIVAHLGPGAHAHQVKLDLVFGLVPQIKFYVAKGSGKINLTGYFQPGPPSDLFDEENANDVLVHEQSKKKEQATPSPAVDAGTKKSKKRARTEKTTPSSKTNGGSVTWDQASFDDSSSLDDDDEGEEEEKPQQPKKETPQPKKEHKQPTASLISSNPQGSGKKKNRNKKRKNKQ